MTTGSRLGVGAVVAWLERHIHLYINYYTRIHIKGDSSAADRGRVVGAIAAATFDGRVYYNIYVERGGAEAMLGLQLRRRRMPRCPPRLRREVIRSKLGTPSARQSSMYASLPVTPGRPLASGRARRSRPIDFRSRAGVRRGSMLAARPAAAAEARVHHRHEHGDRRRQRRHRHKLSQSRRRSRAHARTRRQNAANVADPRAVRPRSHRIVFEQPPLLPYIRIKNIFSGTERRVVGNSFQCSVRFPRAFVSRPRADILATYCYRYNIQLIERLIISLVDAGPRRLSVGLQRGESSGARLAACVLASVSNASERGRARISPATAHAVNLRARARPLFATRNPPTTTPAPLRPRLRVSEPNMVYNTRHA